jgi:hypothetical protein
VSCSSLQHNVAFWVIFARKKKGVCDDSRPESEEDESFLSNSFKK